ncbi:MAG: metalloregulator ArsR/SmtB family transcription factor [Halieaceae bacterium]|jgi:DNA-binding transcriptional ArsR family regulator|nr:metalloregulator ArsR/SmtB family transcription factor [Halieaceae bacterium]
MPNRKIVARELSALLKVLSHPDRIQIIQFLASRGEHSVSNIAEKLDLPQTRVSQHLALLRTHRLVVEQAEGRERIYDLSTNQLAWWLVDGVDFVAGNIGDVTDEQVSDARNLWVGAFTDARFDAARKTGT